MNRVGQYKKYLKYLASLGKHFKTIADTLQNIKKKGLIKWFGEGIWGLLKADLPESMGGRSRTAVPQKHGEAKLGQQVVNY